MANAEAEGEKAFCPPSAPHPVLARAAAACRDEQFFGMKLRAPLYATRRARDRPPPTSSRIASGEEGVDERERTSFSSSLSPIMPTSKWVCAAIRAGNTQFIRFF